MNIDIERWIADYLGTALLAALAVFAWLSIVAQRLEKARGLSELCREARKIRDAQEKLYAAGKSAPLLEGSRRVEAGILALLARYGVEVKPAKVDVLKSAARR